MFAAISIRTLVALAPLLLLATPGVARGEEETAPDRHAAHSAADIVFDATLLRPTGLVVLACGTALFAPAAVLAAPGGRMPLGEGLERFVLAPGRYVFTRRLGDF